MKGRDSSSIICAARLMVPVCTYYISFIIYSRKGRIKGRDSSRIICALDGAGMHAFYAVIGAACMLILCGGWWCLYACILCGG